MARHHVHLSQDVETARRVGARRGKPVILVIDAIGLAARGETFMRTGNGVWLTAHVPVGFFRRLS
jgi:putative RNA 2'-phosphotransferase